jgi:DnaD/phage-associated family protein
MPFDGFPRRMRQTPVPNPVFGPLLEQIDSIDELKLTLRVVWLLHNKKGYPRSVTLSELEADRVLARALPETGGDHHRGVRVALEKAVARGTLVCDVMSGDSSGERVYALNTERDARGPGGTAPSGSRYDRGRRSEGSNGPVERPNVFALYEDNIGMLSPMIADELREAEELYPAEWIEDAFREAVENNARSWRYVARILERWEREGRSDGERGRYPKEAGHYKEFFRR